MVLINGRTPEAIKRGLECYDVQKCAGQRGCDECPNNVYTPDEVIANAPILDALAYIQQLESAQMKWIGVDERLPEKSGKYIVCTTKKSVYCTRFETHHSGGDFMTDINTHVTHWMPLPEPPEEG